jgi:hypothetical protein
VQDNHLSGTDAQRHSTSASPPSAKPHSLHRLRY